MGAHGRGVVFDRAGSAVFTDPHCDVLLIHYVAGLEENLPDLKAFKQKADLSGKVILFWLMGRKQGCKRFRQEARALGIPVHEDVGRIAECLLAASRFKEHQSRLRGVGGDLTLPSASKRPPLPLLEKVWDEFDSKRFLARWKIPVVEEALVKDLKETLDKARETGWPVVLKGLMPGQAHKTEQGLVRLGILDKPQLETAFQHILGKLGPGGRILLQKEIKFDYELIAGFIRDDQFGPCVMFGLGGIFSELEPDVAFALAPLDRKAALEFLERIHGRRLLRGFRGKMPLKKETMADILVRLGQVGATYSEIAQIDINPLVVSEGMPLAVDANVILKS